MTPTGGLRHVCTPMLLALLLVTAVASAAEAGRWRKGARPAGTTYTERKTVDGRTCHYRPEETGTNECRWKRNWGCKWSYDSGSNQCTPGADTTPKTAVTLTATNGSITVQSIVDGDAKDDTYAAIVTVRKASTGEAVTGKIRLRIPITDPLAITVLSKAVTGIQTMQKDIPATSLYRPLNWSTSGWTLGGDPPPAPPPGSYTCYVAWENYVQQQFLCFNQVWGQALRSSMMNGIYVGYSGAIGCGFASGGSLASFLECEGKVVGAGFVYGFVNSVFGGPDPNGEYCNAAAYARYLMSQHCEPTWPR